MTFSVNFGQKYLTMIPTAMGSITTQRMLRNMLATSTWTLLPAKAQVSRGVRNGANSVETPVMPTERAKSPLAR